MSAHHSVLPLILALLPTLTQAALPAKDQLWREGRTRHFHLTSQVDEASTRDLAQALEQLYSIMQQLAPDLRQRRLDGPAPAPVKVILFPNRDQLKRYSPAAQNHAGLFTVHVDGHLILMDAGAKDPTAVVFHEFIHEVMASQYGPIPIWLNEGLATFFETMRRDGAEIQLGQPPNHYLQELTEHGPLPVTRLLAATHTSPDYVGPAQHQFYASSWLLVDYLLTAGPERRAQLTAYLEHLRLRKDPLAGFTTIFQSGPAELDQALKEYVRLLNLRGTIQAWKFQFTHLNADTRCAMQPLSRAETLARLGLLLIQGSPASRGQAREHLSEALRLEPGSGTGNYGMGLLTLAEGQTEPARPYLLQACRSEPDNGEYQYLAAQALGTGSPAERLEAAQHLLRSLELGASHPESLDQLSGLGLMDSIPTAEALDLLSRAHQRFPQHAGLALSLAQRYQRSGQSEPAQALLSQLSASADPAGREAAATALAQLRRDGAARLYQQGLDAFNQKRYDEALAKLDAAVRDCPTPAQAKSYQEQRDKLKILIDLRQSPKPAAKAH